METTPARRSPPTPTELRVLHPPQVWNSLTPGQQHGVFQTILVICQELVATADDPGRERPHE